MTDLENSKCDICGKTIAERIAEGWEFEPSEKMEDTSIRWCTAVCPVCKDIIENIANAWFTDEFFEDQFENLMSKFLSKHGFQIQSRENQKEKTQP